MTYQDAIKQTYSGAKIQRDIWVTNYAKYSNSKLPSAETKYVAYVALGAEKNLAGFFVTFNPITNERRHYLASFEDLAATDWTVLAE